MITEALSKIMGWKVGFLLHEGFQVKCRGMDGTDADGSPVTDRHLICTLDSHLPGADAHAIGNSEFTDDLWILADGQQGVDWTSPKCQICNTEISP